MGNYMVHKAIELDAISTKQKAILDGYQEWIISPKYDGCHVIFCFDHGALVAAYSRTGEVVQSMDHIARDLLALYPIDKGRIAICGEAWMVGEEFNVISGTFRRQSAQPQLQFVPFDIVPFDYNEDATGLPVLLGQAGHRLYPAPYKQRLLTLINQRKTDVPTQVLLPRCQSVVGTLDEAFAIATAEAQFQKKRSDSFFDGAVLAKADGKYIVGSGKGGEFIKCKPLISYSVKVGAVVSDVGTKTGKSTCVLMFTLDGKLQKVSTGLSQQQADEFTEDPSRIIDSIIEVEAMGKTVNGFLREPRFKGIRTDA